MKKFFETFTNIFKIQELRSRVFITLGLILVYRLGSTIVIPGVKASVLAEGGNLASQSKEGMMAFINMFSGGAFSNASILALGIMPYISASILVQLLSMAVPYFQKIQREGESGRMKINQLTRYLTVVLTLLQGTAYIANLHTETGGAVIPEMSGFMFNMTAIFTLLAGTMFVLWLGERITDKGIGNGVSIIIMVGIVAQFLPSLIAETGLKLTNGGGAIIALLVEFFVLGLIVVLSIMLLQATRKVPVNYAKGMVVGDQFSGVRNYLPLKVNAAGVMPIIFAQAILMLPSLALPVLSQSYPKVAAVVGPMFDPNGAWHYVIVFVLIILFTYFYTAITYNPTQIAEDLKRNNGFVPGIKPGKDTADFLDAVMSKITLPGSFFLGIIAILPYLAMSLGIESGFATFFGGTSLLILVGVVLDTLQQIDSYMLNMRYDGLMKSGRVQGRTTTYEAPSI